MSAIFRRKRVARRATPLPQGRARVQALEPCVTARLPSDPGVTGMSSSSTRIDGATSVPEQNSALDRWYRGVAERAGKAPGGHAGLKAVVFVIGLLFVLGGVALAVLPGPLTIPPILVGVYVWSLEFGWARRLRVRVNKSAREAWASAKEHPVRASVITIAGLVAAGVVIWAVGHYDLIARAKDLVS